MSPSWYQWFSYVTSLYIMIWNLVLFLVLWRRAYPEEFNRRHFMTLNRKTKVLSVSTLILVFVMNLVLVLWQDNPGKVRYIASAAVILGYSFLRFEKKCGKTVFLLSLFYNFHCLSFLISTSVYQSISDFLIQNLNFEQADYLEKLYERLAFGQVVLLLTYTACFFLMMFISLKIMKAGLTMNWQDVLFLSVLNIVGILLAGMVADLLQVKIENEVFLLYDNRREMLWKIPLLAMLLYAGEISAISIYQKNIELQKEKQQRFVEEQETRALKRRLEEAEEFYGSIHKIRHEMRNHMTNIKGLVAGEQYHEVEHYIARLDATIQELDYKYVTGNPVTDVIINDKYRKARGDNISFTVDFHYGETCRIPVFDIGIILNNLLDNAIEACERVAEGERYIQLKVRKRDAFLLIETKNSFDGRIVWDTSDPYALPATTKSGERTEVFMEHGLGLKNIKEIAERYLGGMDIRIEGKEFRITVMLQEGK